MHFAAAFWLSLMALLPARAAAPAWCGYALIEGMSGVESQIPILSLIVPEEKESSDPSDLFQYRLSLDGTKAIIEGCWKIFPSREVVVNLLTLSGNEKEALDLDITYSLFAPGGTREDSAASVRAYLIKNNAEWEPDEP